MRLLVTRPEPDAERTAAALRARGHEVILAPMLRIEAERNVDFGSGPFAGVAITSANAARLVAAHPRRSELAALPLYAVGRRSAETAREVGFTTVIAADKDVDALAQTIRARHAPTAAPLLYLAAADRAGDLAGALGAYAISVRTVTIYRAVKAAALPEATRLALQVGNLDGVLHFSRRTAEAYVDCARAGGLLREALAATQYCVSSQVGAPLAAAGAAEIAIAPHPSEEALLALI
jgi:uroporphyrinogen-III synthase